MHHVYIKLTSYRRTAYLSQHLNEGMLVFNCRGFTFPVYAGMVSVDRQISPPLAAQPIYTMQRRTMTRYESQQRWRMAHGTGELYAYPPRTELASWDSYMGDMRQLSSTRDLGHGKLTVGIAVRT
jgi:hypothetical protein